MDPGGIEPPFIPRQRIVVAARPWVLKIEINRTVLKVTVEFKDNFRKNYGEG